MKATVEMIGNRYSIVGLEKPNFKVVNAPADKAVYELKFLYTFGSKTYKTLANAIRAIEKNGFEYVPAESIFTVCAYD